MNAHDSAADVPATTRVARPSRPPVPALPALDQLDRTHRQMLQTLEQLGQLVEHLDAHGVDATARATARTICAFFAEHARRHHADEETLVFPLLIARQDPGLTQHVLRLQQDHGWLEEDWLELAPQLQAVGEGYSWYEIDGLRHGVGVFTALYQEHIALEESMIYPAARREADAQAAADAASRAARHADLTA
ncbi:hemerythrin domain-containing protein [Pseudaquabacterium rugosum]|uniref:Hemerythrin domain-containing protein n=1 Tax=Pseudaquabacterium rugosum TaxID=2984194 RepID=A0ABU9B8S1_9BURK